MPFYKDQDKMRQARRAQNLTKNYANNTYAKSGGTTGASSFGGFGGVKKVNSGNSTQYTFQLKPRTEWNAAEASAYGRLSNDNSIFTELSLSTDQRGSQYWNPYRAGRAVISDEARAFFKNNLNYEGPYDQRFVNEVNAIFGPYAELTRSLAVGTPSKKDPIEVWGAFYANQFSDKLADNLELNRQWAEARQKYSDFYDQYKKINGRDPSLEEFVGAVDRTKYSKLNSIDQSLKLIEQSPNYETQIQYLPLGTFYSPDILAGLYNAKKNGKDITVDRDYFEDAVQEYMNPIQNSQAMKKYDWSNDDLSQVSAEDRDKYIAQKRGEGNFEEAADFGFSWWAAQPHDDSITAEPFELDARYGYYHDEAWFEKAHADLGDEWDKRLQADGSMDSKLKSGDLMDKTIYQLYQLEKNREKTLGVENEFGDIKSKIQDFFAKNAADYTDDDPSENYDNFRRDVLYSRKAAWLRDGNGELDIVEYQHVNHQAMVSFVWHVKGEIKAVTSITTEIESEYEDYSVWNVDDDGRYGIPDVVTIAQDKDGAVTVFLAKNAPESITCFALHQQGSAFQLVQVDQWYRFVD